MTRRLGDRLAVAAGAVIVMAAGSVFAAVAINVVSGGSLAQLDLRAASWFTMHSDSAITYAMLLVSATHGTVPVLLMALVFGIYVGWKREWLKLLSLTAAVPGGMLLNHVIKEIVARPRPQFPDPAVTLTSYSFPSGHAVAATVFYGFLACHVLGRVRNAAARTLVTLVAAVMIVVVCFSRIYLRAHYVSDTVAGVCEAIAWLAVCLTVARAVAMRSAARGLDVAV